MGFVASVIWPLLSLRLYLLHSPHLPLPHTLFFEHSKHTPVPETLNLPFLLPRSSKKPSLPTNSLLKTAPSLAPPLFPSLVHVIAYHAHWPLPGKHSVVLCCIPIQWCLATRITQQILEEGEWACHLQTGCYRKGIWGGDECGSSRRKRSLSRGSLEGQEEEELVMGGIGEIAGRGGANQLTSRWKKSGSW